MKTKKQEDSVSAHIVVAALEKQAVPVIKKVTDLEIKSNADYQAAANLLSQLSTYEKEAEAKRTGITQPMNAALRNVNALFKPFADKVELVKKTVKARMTAWDDKQEAERKKLEAKFETGEIKKMSTLTQKLEAATVYSSSSTTRMVKVLRIVDASKIPREYLVPDEAKIKAAFKEGKAVLGCTWKEEKQIAIS
jgi:hypothetical protein